MANWATRYTQKSRLPVAANPIAELFHCERMACKLTRTACVNRFQLAQGKTRDGLSDIAVTYGACRTCDVGAANARGGPMTEPAETTIMTSEVPPRIYEERRCRRGLHMFRPTSARDRACADQDCKSKHAQAPAPAPARPAKGNGRKLGRVVHRIRGPVRAEPVAAPAAELRTAVASPAELLELAGFSVREIRTPSGVLLQVT